MENQEGDIEQIAPGVYRDVKARVLYERRRGSLKRGIPVSSVSSSGRKAKVLDKVDRYLKEKDTKVIEESDTEEKK